MERDLIGYGEKPPAVGWPNGARIAINLVVNYEEGSENRHEDGSGRRESLGEALSPVPADARDLANESMFEYGSRAGVWRLLRLFEKHDVKSTFFACAVALARHPAVARAITAGGHDVLGHGDRWQEHFLLDREAERAAIDRAAASIKATTGQAPAGWYCRYGPSVNTRELVVASGHFLYDSDAYNDDLPYYVRVGGRPWLVVPYALDTNDIRFWRGGLNHGDDFYRYLSETFAMLYEEGATCPRMMSVGLHCRIAGRPGRAAGLDRFLAETRRVPNVWFARRSDIARWWLEHHRPDPR